MTKMNEKITPMTGPVFIKRLSLLKGFELPEHTIGITLKAFNDGLVQIEIDYLPDEFHLDENIDLKRLFKGYELKLIKENKWIG